MGPREPLASLVQMAPLVTTEHPERLDGLVLTDTLDLLVLTESPDLMGLPDPTRHIVLALAGPGLTRLRRCLPLRLSDMDSSSSSRVTGERDIGRGRPRRFRVVCQEDVTVVSVHITVARSWLLDEDYSLELRYSI